MERPSRDEILMDTARLVALRSTCSRLHVGAVASKDGRPLVSGYNGAPAGVPHCSHTTDESCKVSVHAEANVIAYAARWGIKLEGAELFTTHSPCLACCQLIVNSGVSRVVFAQLFREAEGLWLLKSGGIIVEQAEFPSRVELI